MELSPSFKFFSILVSSGMTRTSSLLLFVLRGLL